MAKVISLINWKGGVGKTTMTLHLAAGLASKYNVRVLLIDLDAQCNLSFLGIGLSPYVNYVYQQNGATLKNIFDAYFTHSTTFPNVILQNQIQSSAGRSFPNIDIILSHQELTLLDLTLAREKRPGKSHCEETKFEIDKLSIVKSLVEAVSQSYQYILIDCPPNVNLITQNAFFASDYYVIPAIPDFLSTIGISLIRNYMDNFNRSYGSMWSYAQCPGSYVDTKFGGIIFNMVDEYSNRPKDGHKEFMQNVSITQQPSNSVFNSYVTDGDGISTAAQMNLPVFAYNDLPRANQNAKKQATYMMSVVDEFVQRIV